MSHVGITSQRGGFILLQEPMVGLISAVMGTRKRSLTATLLGLHRQGDLSTIKARLRERDQRLAADNRTAMQKWLGDPPLSRSALANHDGAAVPRWIYHQTRRRQKPRNGH